MKFKCITSPIKNGVFLLTILIFFSCSNKKENVQLRIATAANMQFAMKELVQEFSEKTGITCETIVSSSGKLTAQIKAGAAYDIFVSANTKYPNELYKSRIVSQKPEIYAYGSLVLWTLKDGLKPSVELLQDNRIKHIAVANPKTAPYGSAAIIFLKNTGVYDQVKPKLVFGESISSVNQFIFSESAEIGFTAQSVVLSPKMKGKGQWLSLNADVYPPIEQGVVLIPQKEEKRTENAAKFYKFLFSPEAQQILREYGYQPAK
ncbi:molybdate ABC transporter substrate-binding protein [Autumnicola musiva]|uniref:Molybdate ABC transporter substrate-binding protein n=1 Tax=Autumnicola musiva TaxID=3075589 RepID=A0ABU3D7D3_9FLAO|nr:molybdate ABC transporter substrate-binding protein [Zunongwangia sp. F117]MDT0677284.1 molybdate ABC transporter substrate-binding protein [Zunongwangia sp. F117]